MNYPRSWKRIFIILLFCLIPLFSHAEDTIDLGDGLLSNEEMAEIRGGFSFNNGDYMHFSMDYMRLNFLSQTDSPIPNSTGFVNAISQRARITDEGIEFDMDIFQGGSVGQTPGGGGGVQSFILPQGGAGSLGGNSFTLPSQTNQIGVNNSFTDFTGLANANFITGNYNTASIVNIFNIKMDIIRDADFSKMPQFQNFLTH